LAATAECLQKHLRILLCWRSLMLLDTAFSVVFGFLSRVEHQPGA
jgi:hypothetical protein